MNVVEGLRQNDGESEPAENKIEDSEFAPFDKAKAQAEQDRVRAEILQEPKEMLGQLEKMGVDERIVENVAFRRELEKAMSSYGIELATKVDLESEDRELKMDCQDKKGDSRHHDRSEMRLEVKDDGSLLMKLAAADRRGSRMAKGAFGGYEGHSDELTIDENRAGIVEFKLSQDGQALMMSEQSSFEQQVRPKFESANGKKFGNYFGQKTETTRVFDASGDEQWKETREYKAQKLEGDDFLSSHLGSADGDIRHASFNFLSFSGRLGGDIKEVTKLSRNEDGTIKVYNHAEGEPVVEIERCQMDTQHGTSELVPENRAIAAAREKKEQEEKNL